MKYHLELMFLVVFFMLNLLFLAAFYIIFVVFGWILMQEGLDIGEKKYYKSAKISGVCRKSAAKSLDL